MGGAESGNRAEHSVELPSSGSWIHLTFSSACPHMQLPAAYKVHDGSWLVVGNRMQSGNALDVLIFRHAADGK